VARRHFLERHVSRWDRTPPGGIPRLCVVPLNKWDRPVLCSFQYSVTWFHLFLLAQIQCIDRVFTVLLLNAWLCLMFFHFGLICISFYVETHVWLIIRFRPKRVNGDLCCLTDRKLWLNCFFSFWWCHFRSVIHLRSQTRITLLLYGHCLFYVSDWKISVVD